MNVTNVLFNFQANYSQVVQAASAMVTAMRGIVAAVTTMGGAFGGLLVGVAAVAALAATAVVAGIQFNSMAADFQQGINRLVTGAGDVTDNMTTMGKAILDVSVYTGATTTALLAAMYPIISAGQRGSEALNTLTVAAEGAAAEQANLTDVANVLSGAMTNYGTSQFTATQFMNGFMEAVQSGKITLQELAVAMGPIDPIAQSLGIHFNDVAAAMTTQTNAMIPAARAATSLRFLMLGLENPTAKATQAMREWGLDSVAVANEMKQSLPGALQMIYDAAKKAGPEGSVPFNRAVSDMVGGIRGLSSFLALTGTHMAAFVKNSADILAAMTNGKEAVKGWDVAQGNYNQQVDRGRAALAALGIVIGSKLLPGMTTIVAVGTAVIASFTQWILASGIVDAAAKAIGDAFLGMGHAIQATITFFQQNELAMDALKGTLIALAAVVGGALVVALYSAASAAWTFAAGMIVATWPVLLIIVAIAALAAAFIYFYNTSAPFRAVIAAIGQAFVQLWGVIVVIGGVLGEFLVPILRMVWAFIVANFLPVWQQLVQMWQSQMLPMLKQLWSALQPLVPVLELIAAVVVGVLIVAFAVLIAAIMAIIKGLAGFISGIIIVIQGVVQIITGVFQVIGGIVAVFTDIFTGHFERLQSDMLMIWQGIVNIFQGAWGVIAGIFLTAWYTISGIVVGFVQGIIGFFQSLANTIVGHSIIPDMVTSIVAWFFRLGAQVVAAVAAFVAGVISGFVRLGLQALAAITSMVAAVIGRFNAFRTSATSIVQSAVGAIGNILSTLAGIAINAANNFIGGLVNGIRNGVGAVGAAVQSVVSAIANFLPHSPAKEGPLRDLNVFGPALVMGFASGIVKTVPVVVDAAKKMVAPLQPALAQASPGATAYRPVVSVPSSATGSTTIILQIDGNELMQALGPGLTKQVLLQVTKR